MRFLCSLVAAGTLLASAVPASAAVIDPAGDLLATYTGPVSGEVDILRGDVAFDGTSFFFTATLAADVDPTPGQLYAWGINRGAGTPRIDLLRDPDIAGDILFDAVVVMLPNGTLTVAVIPLLGPPAFTTFAGGTVVDGDTISGLVPLSLLAPNGSRPKISRSASGRAVAWTRPWMARTTRSPIFFRDRDRSTPVLSPNRQPG